MPEDYDETTTDLLTRVAAITEDEDAWTWLDADPDVAWEDPSSYHGRLAEIYLEAGWEKCYHGDGRFHFNVKVRSGEQYRGYRKVIDSRPNADEDLIIKITGWEEESRRELWWENDLPDTLYDLGHREHVYSCGRSGGYVTSPRALDNDPASMVKVAAWLRGQVEYHNSEAAGAYLAEEVLRRYDEEMMVSLASPRPQRIEA